MSEVKKFIIDYVKRYGDLPKEDELDGFDFIKVGYIDSLAVFKFIAKIEQKFDIELTEEELLPESSRTIGGLERIVLKKITS